VCTDFAAAERREWLVTNGLGGFAGGTVAGTQTRRYHGLLIAATRPPVDRKLLVAKLDETVHYGDTAYELSANRWLGGSVSPSGFDYIESFRLEGSIPTWTFALADALLEKRIWMEFGANTTYVQYRLVRGSEMQLDLRCFVNYRDFHATTRAGDWRMRLVRDDDCVRVEAFEGARPFWIAASRGSFAIEDIWYRDYFLACEAERGLDALDDNLLATALAIQLGGAVASVTIAVSDTQLPAIDGESAYRRTVTRTEKLISMWAETPLGSAGDAPAWIEQCVLAADQFIVRRPIAGDPYAASLIAGYPWFSDWGRDAMIALPGLTMVTGRYDIARKIILTFARFVDRGMIPNFFPDAAEQPEYNTVDAALWYVEAVARYIDDTHDLETLRSVFGRLEEIVACYHAGTRYGIHIDPEDGLLAAGEEGVQLTWMDAKVGDFVVTPRRGKPVEINALWYNALQRLAEMAPLINRDGAVFARKALAARCAFERFWSPSLGYCYDVVDGPEGDDPTLRPNQLLALSLPFSPLSADRARSIVGICQARLLVPGALRSLDPRDHRYVPRYGGSPLQRDGAYHQGTAWLWLIAPFAIAHARTYGDVEVARSFLAPLEDRLRDGGLGTLEEICDGAAPFTPRGAIAQAWSVAEALRAWRDIPAAAARRYAAPT